MSEHIQKVLRGEYDVPYNPPQHATVLDSGENVGGLRWVGLPSLARDNRRMRLASID